MWGKEGSDEGEFSVPTSIAIDTEGNFYVSEVNNSRVQIFDASGKFLSLLAPDVLAAPHGIVFDEKGDLYLADTGHNVVRKFRLTQNLSQ